MTLRPNLGQAQMNVNTPETLGLRLWAQPFIRQLNGPTSRYELLP